MRFVSLMHFVAGHAGEVALIMGASLPVRPVAAFVTGEAERGLLRGGELFRIPDLRRISRLRMRGARPVTGLAARDSVPVGSLRHAVARLGKMFGHVFVAGGAGLRSGIAVLRMGERS